jgi:hypothetical protein
MLPIVARGQSMDGTLAKFAGIPFAALRGLKNSRGDDFAVHLRLTDIQKHLTGEVVCLVRRVNFLWVKGQILEELIGIGQILRGERGRSVAANTAGALSDFRKKIPANCGGFYFKSVGSGIGFGARLRYGRPASCAGCVL